MLGNEMDVRRRGFSEYIRLEKALEKIFSKLDLLESEKISFEQAAGRVISEDIKSEVNVPPFDRSAMDGFAVRAEDTFGADENNPKNLRLVGSVEMGTRPELEIGEGEAADIATGAPMPEGADATVMLEKTQKENSNLIVFEPVSPGENVSSEGEDIESGDVVLEANRRLRPSDLGLLASTGNLEVKVRKKPEVGIAATGSELKEPGEEIGPGEIIETNSRTLGPAVELCGGEFTRLGVVSDDLGEIKEVLSKASDFDVLVLTGGSSVGEKDLVPLAISEVGDLVFHGVAMRPGSPSAFGVVDGVPVFSLAGFPAANLVAFELIVRPALRVIQGLSGRGFRLVLKGVLGRKISSSLGRVDFVRVRLERVDGEYRVFPVRVTGSSILRSIAEADGFVVVPEDLEGFSKGEEVEVFPLDL